MLFKAYTLYAVPALSVIPALFAVRMLFAVLALFEVEVAEPTVDVGAVAAECNTALFFIRIGL